MLVTIELETYALACPSYKLLAGFEHIRLKFTTTANESA